MVIKCVRCLKAAIDDQDLEQHIADQHGAIKYAIELQNKVMELERRTYVG
jgi:hypothetical protein